MLGRAPYQNPWLLSEVDAGLFDATDRASASREATIEAMLPYITEQLLKRGPAASRHPAYAGVVSGPVWWAAVPPAPE